MTDDILFEERGGLRLITLNRPKALNAISLAMVRAMAAKLAAWAADDDVQLVLILGAGGKAFAAGGDIQKLYDEMTAGDMAYPQEFFGEEYRLNNVIKRYPKPYVALYNGIVMGGGVGVSVHGSHRIATDATTFAMPETGIGFFPDVGGTYFLPRLVGMAKACELIFTGKMIDAAEALRLGIVTELTTPDGLMPAVRALAAEIAAGPPIAIRLARRWCSATLWGPICGCLTRWCPCCPPNSISCGWTCAVMAFRTRRRARMRWALWCAIWSD